MSETPYDGILSPTELDRAVDAAIEGANARFLANPEAQRVAAELGERWRVITEARELVGRHAVVLPRQTAVEVLRVLRDGEPQEPVTREMLARLVEQAIPENAPEL